jgi:hypothetical protein
VINPVAMNARVGTKLGRYPVALHEASRATTIRVNDVFRQQIGANRIEA